MPTSSFDPAATRVATPVAEVFAARRGVCQDFSHLMIACLRALGLAARYVSGYLLTEPPPGQPRLIGADASHAWVALWCPGAGWVDVDPTNDLQPGSGHITLAWGRDYGDVCPLRGVILGGGGHRVEVAVTVMPVDDGRGRVARGRRTRLRHRKATLVRTSAVPAGDHASDPFAGAALHA